MKTHTVKSWPEYFAVIKIGSKTFDLRKNDRNYQEGDDVVFEEFRPGIGTYTGRSVRRRITYVLREFDGLMPGYCILALLDMK